MILVIQLPIKSWFTNKSLQGYNQHVRLSTIASTPCFCVGLHSVRLFVRMGQPPSVRPHIGTLLLAPTGDRITSMILHSFSTKSCICAHWMAVSRPRALSWALTSKDRPARERFQERSRSRVSGKKVRSLCWRMRTRMNTSHLRDNNGH